MAEIGQDKEMVASKINRRQLLTRAWRAGVGVGALALAGCEGPETYNARRDGAMGDEEGEPAPLASPLAGSAEEQETQETMEGEVQEEQEQQQVRPARGPITIPIREPLMPDDVVDPLVWRERYHWRELAKLPGQQAGPIRGGGLFLHAPAQISWTPFDPQQQAGSVGTFLPLVYSQLVVMAAGDHQDAHRGEIEGDLAASWEFPEPISLVFNIREDVRWPESEPLNGRELTASDVQISHDLFRSSALPQRSAYGAVERIDADDGEMTVTFQLSEPTSYLLAQMTGPLHVVGPPHQIDNTSEEITYNQIGIDHNVTSEGTGPYRLEYASPVSWGAVRNPLYFKQDQTTGQRLPYYDRLRAGVLMSKRPSTSSLLAPRFEIWQDWIDRRFDVLELVEPSELEQSLSLFPNAAAQVVAPTPGQGSVLTFRGIRNGPFADVRVRHALSATIDRVRIAERVHRGLAAPDCGHDWTHIADDSSSSGFREWPWTPEELGDPYTFNPVRARALLGAAGYSAEQPLAIYLDAGGGNELFGFIAPGEVATAAHQWQTHLGAAVEVKLLPRIHSTVQERGSQFSIQQVSDDARILAAAFPPRYAADPDDLTYGRLHSSVNPFLQDAELDELCEQQRRELDPVQRSELLERIRKRDLELSGRLPLVNRYGLFARQGNVFNVGGTHIAHSFDLNPKQFEQAWQLPE